MNETCIEKFEEKNREIKKSLPFLVPNKDYIVIETHVEALKCHVAAHYFFIFYDQFVIIDIRNNSVSGQILGISLHCAVITC